MEVISINTILIHNPEIVKGKQGVRIQTKFEVNNQEKILWYEVDAEYEEYLTVERADAFFIALLLFALKNGLNMQILAPMSARLYYTVKKYLSVLIQNIHGYRKIDITCNQLISKPLNSAGAVGTGLSCGVDSFSTIYDHMNDDSLQRFNVDYFTFFNVGSHGSFGGLKASKLYRSRMVIAKACADELGKKLITVDSNLSEILDMDFVQTHTIRSISAVLTLQKLFDFYYYSSAVHIKNFKIDKYPAYYDVFGLSMISTENTNLYSLNAISTRVEKTKMIADFKPAQKFLNVCVMGANNCGKCFKCLRTLLTLEIIGKINLFSSSFNLSNYYKNKLNFLAYVLANSDSDIFCKEIHDEISATKFNVPLYTLAKSKYMKTRRLMKL